MKKALFLFVLLLGITSVYAGDVANLVVLGFSKDASKFAFGFHGVQDKTYQAYANIYVIDAVTNDFLDSGVFKTSPTKTTYAQNSKTTFLALQNRAASYLKKYDISEERLGRPIYSQSEEGESEKNLMFRDFETNSEYTVTLHSKTNNRMESSFYITCDVINSNGNKRSYKVGREDVTRRGVKSYAIKKVIIDGSGSTLVFIIEKKEAENGGDSIRYMAEVVKL